VEKIQQPGSPLSHVPEADIPLKQIIGDSSTPRPDLVFDLRVRNDKLKRDTESRLREIFGDKTVMDALMSAAETKGIRAESISRIVAARPKHPGVRVQFDEENRALVFNISNLGDGLRGDVRKCLCEFLGVKPLRGEFKETEHARLVPKEELERALRIARWEDFNPDEYDGGRSVLVKLRKQVNHNGVNYRWIKIKAAGYNGILPPQPRRFIAEKPGEKPHEIQIPDVDDEGGVIFLEQLNPRGGLTEKASENEVKMMQKNFERGLTLDIALGHGVYSDLVMEGEKLGFVVSLVPEVRDMADVIEGRKAQAVIKSKDSIGVYADKLRDDINDIFTQQGRMLRKAHDNGIYMAFPHWGNAYTLKGKYYWKDFTETQDITGVGPGREVAFRLIDMVQAVQHLQQLPFFEDKQWDFWHKRIMVNLPIAFLMGYFHDRLSIFDKQLLQTQNDDIVGIMIEGSKKPVHTLDSRLVREVEDVAAGRDYKDIPNIPQEVLIYPYVERETKVGKAVWDIVERGVLPQEKELLARGIWKVSIVEAQQRKAVSGVHLESNSAFIELPSWLSEDDVPPYVSAGIRSILQREKGA